jgi:hypothetical protein
MYSSDYKQGKRETYSDPSINESYRSEAWAAYFPSTQGCLRESTVTMSVSGRAKRRGWVGVAICLEMIGITIQPTPSKPPTLRSAAMASIRMEGVGRGRPLHEKC